MIRVQLGDEPYDVRLFLSHKGVDAHNREYTIETELSVEDLMISRLSLNIDGDSKRSLVIETQRFTLDGVVQNREVAFERLDYEIRHDIDTPDVENKE